MLADACAQLGVPAFAVLGEAGGTDVGIVVVKGFVGGFPGSHLPAFGEPHLRELYRERFQ